MVVEEAHSTDVNCLSWNAKESHLLVSGGDDGSIKVHACVLCACARVGWWKYGMREGGVSHCFTCAFLRANAKRGLVGIMRTPQYTAIHCNTLQYTAACCSTLQRTATRGTHARRVLKGIDVCCVGPH